MQDSMPPIRNVPRHKMLYDAVVKECLVDPKCDGWVIRIYNVIRRPDI